MYQRLHWFVIVYVLVILGQAMNFQWLLLGIIGVSLYLFYLVHIPKSLIAMLILFAISVQAFIPASPILPFAISSENQTINGTITSMIEEKETYLRFSFQVNETKHKTDVYYFYPSDQETVPSLHSGATCELSGTFQEIPTSRNPGQFDYQQYLATQGIASQFIVDASASIDCHGASFVDKIYQLRFSLLDTLKENLSVTTYAWTAALLFGDKTHLEEDVIELFQHWQLSHLLAISGLHVGLLVAMIYVICLYIFRFTLEKAYVLIICCLPFYPFLSGGAPSVWRATLLAVALLVLRKLPVRLSKTDVLSLIFLSLVFVDHALVYSLAFQFSFLVTYAILISRKLIADPKIGNKWVLLRISLISMVIILPIQLHHFYAFNPLSVLVNLLVIPYFSMVVLPMLVSILLLSPFKPLLFFFDSLFQKIHDLFILGLQLLDPFTAFNWLLGSFPIYYYIPYYLLISLFFSYFEKEKAKKAFISGCVLVLFIGYITIRPYINPNGYITMLDIGQGDAIVIEFPYRKGVIMIDAGGTMSKGFSQASAETFEQIIDPFLQSKGISKIDAIFLSHKDHDHVGSIPFIMENYAVDYVVTSDFFDKNKLEEYQHLNKEVTHVSAKGGQEIMIKDHVFRIHFPYVDQQNANENSLVISSRFGEQTWLFTGDIGAESEIQLMKQSPLLRAEVLKVAHHGSNTSSTLAFLKHIDASYGLISAGENNAYGHPHEEVLDNLSTQGISILRTDRKGAVIYQYTEKSGTLSTYLP